MDIEAGIRDIVTVIKKTAHGDPTHIFILHIAISWSPNIAVKWAALLLPLRELSENGSPKKAVDVIPQYGQTNTETAPQVKLRTLLLRSFHLPFKCHPIILRYKCDPSH